MSVTKKSMIGKPTSKKSATKKSSPKGISPVPASKLNTAATSRNFIH